MDLAAYGLGATDTFQGTGVFSSVKMSRDKEETTPAETAPAKSEATKKAELVESK